MTMLKLYIPTAVDRDAIEHVKAQLIREYGGCTSYEGRGSWKNSDGDIVSEHCVIIESAGDTHAKEVRDTARRLGEYIKVNSDESEVMAVVVESETVVV